MKVILLGYMGSGKSTIGAMLANILGLEFIDLDEFIEKKESLNINEIFKTKGELYFRKIEHLYLKEIIIQKKKIVLALGGGTPCYANNMELISNSEDTKSIYLKASINSLVDRLFNEKEHRPLVQRLSSKEDLTEFIGKHLFERNYFYNQADHSIITDRKTNNDVLEAILFQLYQ